MRVRLRARVRVRVSGLTEDVGAPDAGVALLGLEGAVRLGREVLLLALELQPVVPVQVQLDERADRRARCDLAQALECARC